jgi:hypothetical protein
MESQYGIKPSTQQQLLVVLHVLLWCTSKTSYIFSTVALLHISIKQKHRGNQNDPDWGDLTSTNIYSGRLRIPQSDLF